MPRAKQFGEAEKTKVMAWYDEGVTPKDIAARLGRNADSVRKIIRIHKDLPLYATPPPPKKRSGRPRKTNFAQDDRLRRFILRHPFKTAREIKGELPGFADISVRTIQHLCQKRLGLPSRCAAKKPLLTAKMVKKRLAFCKKHRSWTEKDWESVMFSDESTFRLINPRAQKVRRPSTMNRYKQRYVVVNVKHSASVMVWGCFCGNGGRGSLYFLPPKATMNGDRYMKVLEEKLFPWMERLGATKFLQDGAPCHTSKKVMALLKEKKISVMDWPGNSPDLNPIENLWAIMKARLKRVPNITSLPLLERAIKMMWVKDLPISLMKKLAHSMPKRIQMCIQNQGQMSKY
jgi:transposase